MVRSAPYTTRRTTRHRLTRTLAATLSLAAALTATVTTTATQPALAVTGGHSVSDNPLHAGTGHTTVQLNLDDRSVCSGVLLDDGWIATADHCFTSVTENITVSGAAGAHGTDPGAVTRTPAVYAVTWPLHDVALVRTATDLTEHLGPGLTVADRRPAAGEDVWVRGWGALTPGTDAAAQVPYRVTGLSISHVIPGGMIMLANQDVPGPDGSTTAYVHHGDSGGPIVDAAGQLVGVLSGGVASYAIDDPATGATAYTLIASGDMTGPASAVAATRASFAGADTAEQAQALGASELRHIIDYPEIIAMDHDGDLTPPGHVPEENDTAAAGVLSSSLLPSLSSSR